jgi:hypothetical protein
MPPMVALYPLTHRTGVSGRPNDPPIAAVASILFLGRQPCELGHLLGKQLFNRVPLRWIRLALQKFAIVPDVEFDDHPYGRAHIRCVSHVPHAEEAMAYARCLAVRRFGSQMFEAAKV